MPSSERLRQALRVSLLSVTLASAARAEDGVSADAAAGARDLAARKAETLLVQIRAQAEALDRRERLVQERERTDAAARRQTELRLEELEALRTRVEARLEQLEAATDVRVAHLADLYGRMPPGRAAALIDALDPDLSARILGRMRRSRAAAVLAALPQAHAAELSRRIVRPRETAGAATPLVQTGSPPRRTGSGAASVP